MFIKSSDNGTIEACNINPFYGAVEVIIVPDDIMSNSQSYKIVNRLVVDSILWHYPEKQYRFKIPTVFNSNENNITTLSIERCYLPVWIKQQGMLYVTTSDFTYVYAGHLENVQFGGNTFVVTDIIYDLNKNFGVVFEEMPVN